MRISIILLVTLLLGACCKSGGYSVAVLKVGCSSLTEPSTLKAIRTDRTDISSVIDTLSLGELNSSNSLLIEFEQNAPNYILYIENSSHSDTISDIHYKRKGCKEKIKDFQYKLNGELRTETELILN